MGIATQNEHPAKIKKSAFPRIIVVGNGPVGVHFANQLIQRGFSGQIDIFGDEESGPYNRVKLSAFLNGEMPFLALNNPIAQHPMVTEHLHCRVDHIDTAGKQIRDQYGAWHIYDELIIATGSKPHVPNIDGIQLSGVYCFRHIKDTQALLTRRLKSRQTVVVGGGLLGLETAKAMLRHSTKVLLVHHSERLMNRQLDETAAGRLQKYAEDVGIEFRIARRVQRVNGDLTVESVTLSGGETIECDTVILATGIRPNTDLALKAKLAVNKGVRVDNQLQSSQPNIYAIGECADYEGQVFGLVAPGLEQATILAKNLCGETQQYQSSSLVTELKVLDLPVFSMGKVSEEFEEQIDSELVYQTPESYRRLLFEKGRIVGAIFVGEYDEVKRLQPLIEKHSAIWPWQKRRFRQSGYLFNKVGTSQFPDKTLICNCQQVTAGQIRQCLKEPNSSFETLTEQLKVSTVCGTCKPLIQQIMQQPVEKQPIKKLLLLFAVIAAIVASLVLSLPQPEASQSVQNPGWDWLWTDSLARQISGFTILGMTVISLLLSLRKRLPKVRWLSFDFWRGWHVVLTSLALITLLAHTGASLGDGINRWLILNFLLIVAIGVLSAITAALEGYIASVKIKTAKRTLVWGHIITFWPLPVLLAYHILSVYYF